MLATFDFLKAQDDHGNEIDISPQFTTDAVSCVAVLSLQSLVCNPAIDRQPKPFPCRIVPRMPLSAVKGLAMQDA